MWEYDLIRKERLDLIKVAMLLKALGDNMYKDDRFPRSGRITYRKKEDFDKLADEIIAMPVGQMQSTIQTYMEKQVGYSPLRITVDGRVSQEREYRLGLF